MTVGYPKTINEQIGDYIPEQIALFDIKVGGATILSGEYVTNYMIYTYDGYCTRAPLYMLWITYVNVHSTDFTKAYNAWTTNYDPLQNYDSCETNVYLQNDGVETVRVNHGKVNTTAASTKTGEIPTMTNYVTTDDSTTPRIDTQSTSTGVTTDTESGSTATTTEHSPSSLTVDNVEYTADYVKAEINKKSGNIGVTTSQQMLQSEVELRLNPLVMQYIDAFMRDYTYYVSREWCDYDS